MNKYKALLLAIPLMILMVMPVNATMVFTDVPANHWAIETIQWGTDQAVTKGYPDGTFRPEATVTEAEFLAMLEKSFVKDLTDGTPWYKPYYDLAYQNNYPVTSTPDNVILRSQVAEIVSGAQGVNYTGDHAIQYLLGKGLAKGYDAGKVTIENYHGADTLTRAQAVQFIKNLKDAGIQEIKARPFEPSPVSELPELPAQPTNITNVNQLTPELIQTIKTKQVLKYDQSWTTPNDKYNQEYVAAIQKDLKLITYDGADTVVISKDMYYVSPRGDKYYRIIVNGNQLWDVGVGFNGESRFATPGAKIGTITE